MLFVHLNSLRVLAVAKVVQPGKWFQLMCKVLVSNDSGTERTCNPTRKKITVQLKTVQNVPFKKQLNNNNAAVKI
jgi:hypothetical protein